MNFARLEGTCVAEYPLSELDVRLRHSTVCLPKDLLNCNALAQLGYFPVSTASKPSFDDLTQHIIEDNPAFLDGVLTQVWSVIDYDAATIAERVTQKQAEIRQQLDFFVTEHIDAVARSMGYENRLSICTYATSTIQTFRTEALAFIAWRDSVWEACLAIQNAVLSGARQIPTPEQLLIELPAFTLP